MTRHLLLYTLAILLLNSSSLRALPPVWWIREHTRIIDPLAQQNNYAPANIGQLKKVASQAKKHLDSALAHVGGAGPEIDALIAGFQNDPMVNYSPANLGQVKAVAKPFYDRLIAVGYDTRQNLIRCGYPPTWQEPYPWRASISVEENYAPANLGQLKMVFSFDLPVAFDENNNGMSDIYEKLYGVSDPNADPDNDGVSNLLESIAGTDPNWGGGYENARFQLGIEPILGGVRLKWWGVMGKRYEIQSTPDLLQPWQFLSGPFVGADDWIIVDDIAAIQQTPSSVATSGTGPSTGTPQNRTTYDGIDPYTPFIGNLHSGLGLWWSLIYDLVGDGSPEEPWDDPDGDGQPNIVESRALTNPWSATSRVQATLQHSGGDLVVEWHSPEGLKFRLETRVTFTVQQSQIFTAEESVHPTEVTALPAQIYAATINNEGPLRLSCFMQSSSWMQATADFSSAVGNGVQMQSSTAQIRVGPNDRLYFVWTGSDGATYLVDTQAAVCDWFRYDIPKTNLDGSQPLNASGDDQSEIPSTNLSENNSTPKRFYRVQVLPSLNGDGDSFDDWEEFVLGTDVATANGKPSWWDEFNTYGPWRRSDDYLPSSEGDNVDAQPSEPNQAVALTASTIPSDFVTAPNITPILLVEGVDTYKYKEEFWEFEQSAAPAWKVYKKSTVTSVLEGGCPESAVGGTITYTWNEGSGLTRTQTGRPIDGDGEWQVTSSTSQTRTAEVSTYDDPPNAEDDCPGVVKETETLSDEYTTSELIANALSVLPSWSGAYSSTTSGTAYKDIGDLETSFGLRKIRFKFQFQGDNPSNLPKRANWMITFTPENGDPRVYRAYTWQGTDAETPVYTIDPMVENGGAEGTYSVFMLPVYVAVNYEPSPPASSGVILTTQEEVLYGPEFGFPASVLQLPPNQPVWEYQMLTPDGTWTNWQEFGRGLSLFHTHGPGIHRIRATFDMDGAKPEMVYVRPIDEPASAHPQEPRGVGPTKAGQHNAIGVVVNEIQRDIVLEARRHIDSQAYSTLADVGLEFPSGTNKCNLFVAHICTDAGAYVTWINISPYLNGQGALLVFPPTANQWYGSQSTSRIKWSTHIPAWTLFGDGTWPQPGRIMAKSGGGSGHVGVMDYDGLGISAGAAIVNRHFSLRSGMVKFRDYTGTPQYPPQ